MSSSPIYSGPMVGASMRSAAGVTPRHPLQADPEQYGILRHQQWGTLLVVELCYPNCTNYEGRKILVLERIVIDDLLAPSTIDPHFTEAGLPLIARFAPTEVGWKNALLFVRAAETERLQT